MGNLKSMELDDTTLRLLEMRASFDGKSVEQAAADLIRNALHQGRDSETLIARASAISAMSPKEIEQSDSASLIREDRDR